MKTSYLLPNKFNRLGWVFLTLSIVLAIVLFMGYKANFLNTTVFAISETSLFNSQKTFCFIENNIQDELISILFVVGAFFIGFSKKIDEDEYISKTRLESLVWATYVNYLILILAVLFIYGLNFLQVLMLNMFTTLIFFLIRFNWLLYQSKKSMVNEK